MSFRISGGGLARDRTPRHVPLTSIDSRPCLSSIILSPLNGNVKLSPYATGDIHVASEGTAKSERDQRMQQGRHGVCQSRRTPVSERAPGQTLEETDARRGGGGSGSRQPRAAQPSPPARRLARADRAAVAQHLRRLQRSPSLRKAGRARGLLAQSRNTAPVAAQARPGLAKKAPSPRSSPAPPAFRTAGRTCATRRQPARLARRPWPPPHRSRHARRCHW